MLLLVVDGGSGVGSIGNGQIGHGLAANLWLWLDVKDDEQPGGKWKFDMQRYGN